MTWTCHARPATLGRTCGHVNTASTVFRNIEVCAGCGCTKKASDDRAATTTLPTTRRSKP
jgi:hypothetical protein